MISRVLYFSLFLALVACDPGPEGTPIDEVEASEPDPSIVGEVGDPPALEEGTYGVTAADCSPDNRFMNEAVIILADSFVYQGEARPLTGIGDDGALVFGEGSDREPVRIEGDRLIRFPDDPALRTVYTRCPDSPLP